MGDCLRLGLLWSPSGKCLHVTLQWASLGLRALQGGIRRLNLSLRVWRFRELPGRTYLMHEAGGGTTGRWVLY